MLQIVEIESYEKLRDRVVSVLDEGKVRAQRAVAEEILRTYHEVGRLLNDYILGYQERANYGDQVVGRLAGEIGLSKTVLYQTLAFFRLEPIFPSRGKLTWTHYKYLFSTPSLEAQKYYQSEVALHGWSVRELVAQIKSGAFEQNEVRQESGQETAKRRSQRRPLKPLRGQIYTYHLAEVGGLPDLRLDVGFGVFLDQNLMGLSTARAGQRVVSRRQGRGYRFEMVAGRKAAYYSYRARVLSVIDGDTLWLDIDCGFGVWTKQKVRLRGIDAPEAKTAEGVRATDFVTQALNDVGFVGVTTTKPDKYDRYLADVFYLPGEEAGDVLLTNGVFLNWELYKAGLVTRFGEGESD